MAFRAPSTTFTRATDPRRCPACTRAIASDDDIVRARGERYHARCMLYRKRSAARRRHS